MAGLPVEAVAGAASEELATPARLTLKRVQPRLMRSVGQVPGRQLHLPSGIGGGVLRDILVRQIPVVLREGLYAIPALIGAAIVVGAARAGAHGPAAAIIGAAVCL